MKRLLVLIVVLGLLGLLGWQIRERLVQSAAVPPPSGPKPLAVELGQARVMDLRHVVELTGSLIPSAQYVVAPKIDGRLEKLLVDIGDDVTRGQTIAVLDSHEYIQEVTKAEAELEVARANVLESQSVLSVAERDLERSRSLRQKNAVSQSELDQALAEFDTGKARLAVAKAQVRQREAALGTAQLRLTYASIKAEWDGPDKVRLVGERFIDEGDMLEKNDPIVSVVAIGQLTAVIHVIERDYPHVAVGQAAELLADAYPGRVFAGVVSRKAPVLNDSSRQAQVEIAVPNAEGLLAPGMFVRVRLRLAQRVDATAVPMNALARRENKQGVFLAAPAGEGKQGLIARFIPLTLGIQDGDWVEVLEPAGLTGEVVTLGKHLLEDGGAISAPKRAAKAEATTNAAPRPEAAVSVTAPAVSPGETPPNATGSAPTVAPDSAPPATAACSETPTRANATAAP